MNPEPSLHAMADDEANLWVAAHLDALMGYALIRVRNREAAEDLVQETLLAAWRGHDAFAGKSSERTWLIGILKRRIVDYYRVRWREQPASELGTDAEGDRLIDSMFDRNGMWTEERPGKWNDPRKNLDSIELLGHLRACLDGLPPRLAEVFTLRELEDLDAKSVCQELGISSTNLWQLMHRARLGLRRCLEKAGYSKDG